MAPPKPLASCTYFAFRMTYRHVCQLYDLALAPTGLRVSQFSLLRLIERHGPIGVQGLADIVRLDRTTVGRNVRPLARDGLVSIAIDPEDRRGRVLSITPAGKARLTAAEPLWQQAQDALEAQFGPDRTLALHRTFESMLALDFTASA